MIHSSFDKPGMTGIFIILLIVLVACTPDVDQSAIEAPNARIAVDVGVVVSDMDRALMFYRDLLGLSVVAEVRTSLIGKGTMVQVQHGASIIKLLQMDTPPDVGIHDGIAAVVGYRYITLMVSDIQQYVTVLQENNEVTVSLPLTELGNGAKIFMVHDPDGNIVEFVEEPTQ